MSRQPVSLRIPDEVRAAIEETVRRTGRDFSSVANEMLAEAVKIRRIPGIAFVDSPTGRVAVVAGTGIKVWLIAQAFRDLRSDWEQLRKRYDWLSEQQLRAALAYAEVYHEEIEAQIRDDERWTPEILYATYPFMRPQDR